jgi:SAM-dependent methyltransferase
MSSERAELLRLPCPTKSRTIPPEMGSTLSLAAHLTSEVVASLLEPTTVAGLKDTLPRVDAARIDALSEFLTPSVAGKHVVELSVGNSVSLPCASQAASWQRVQLPVGVPGGANGSNGAESGTADVVLGVGLLERAWDAAAAVQEAFRRLKPGGIFLVVTPQREGRLWFNEPPRTVEHFREFDRATLSRLLSRHFSVTAVSGLFASEPVATVERRREARDPLDYYLSGPWAAPARVVGRGLRRLASLSQPSNGGLTPLGDSDLRRAYYFDRERAQGAVLLVAQAQKSAEASASSASFDAAEYWKTRLGTCPDLSGTGTLTLPLSWQRWMYHGKERAYLRVLGRNAVRLKGARVVDFGCGTGHFEDFWERAGASFVGGIDLVPAMVEKLQGQFPHRMYVAGDLSGDASLVERFGKLDMATAIDVLYHVVDDEKLLRALRALRGALRPRGYFFFSDALQERNTSEHVKFRSRRQWEHLLAELDLELIDAEPVFAINNRRFAGMRRAPYLVGALQHWLDVPVLRTMPWAANNWAVLARARS